MTLLILLLSLQTLNEEIADERRKAAAEFETMKAWTLARAEYQKILKLDPADDAAIGKLRGGGALPLTQEKLTLEGASRYADLMARIAKVAAPGHAALAKEFAAKGMDDAARRHWRLALLYAPANEDAARALEFVGKGGGAVDALWKDLRWQEALAKADAGKESAKESDLEKKWPNRTTTKRVSESFEWEGVNVAQDHLQRVAQLAEADVAFMRKLLGDDQAMPCVKRVILMTGQSPYLRYIDDFWDSEPSVKALVKQTAGAQNVRRKEFVIFTDKRNDPHHDSYLAHAAGEFMLAAALGLDDYDAPPAWLKEGVGCMCEILFRGKAESSCVALPDGTTTGEAPWRQSNRWDESLRTLVARGSDPELEALGSVTLNAMKGDQRAKSASIVTFLTLRWPEGFRALLVEAKKNPRDVRAMIEKGLGISVEELDEFWRRWIRSLGK